MTFKATAIGALESANTGSMALCLSYQGAIKNAFGIKLLTLSDLSGSVVRACKKKEQIVYFAAT